MFRLCEPTISNPDSVNSYDISACAPYTEYSPLGELNCSPCPADHVCPINSLPYKCRYGQTLSSNRCIDDKSSISYGQCPAGWDCRTNNGKIELVKACSPGTYSPKGAMDCDSCGAGHYCPHPEMGEELECRDGYYGTGTGMTECFPCPAGSSCLVKSATPVFCSNGQFSVVMDSECHDCPEGFYCPNQGNKQIEPCPPGTSSRSVVSARTACDTCAAGNYCMNGKATACSDGYYSLGGAYLCTPCPAGYNCQADSLQLCPNGEYSDPLVWGPTNGECTDCPAGYYCPVPSEFDPEYLKICPIGYFCTEGVSEPTMCDEGTYGYSTGLQDRTDCLQCPAGFYCPMGTPGFPNEEYVCPLGHYCEAGTTAGPQPCPAGRYGDKFGLTSEAECSYCKQGRECAAGSTTPGQPCPVGKFCPADPIGNRNGLGVFCPPGTYNSGTGAADIDKCVPCPAGHYCCDVNQVATWEPASSSATTECTGGVSVPTACRIGSYQSRAGQHTCDLCPAGKKCGATGLTKPDSPCDVGRFCMVGTGDGSGSTVDSVKCPEGTFNDHTNATSLDDCLPCPVGHYCDHPSGNTWAVEDQKPAKCPAGHYCMLGTPKRDTYPCPKGTDGTGLIMATTAMNCTVCEAGFYCPEGTGDTGITKRTCPTGHFCPAGTGGENDADNHIPECPSGTYLDETGKSRVEDCLKCTAGSFCVQGSDQPATCPPGTFSNDDGITSENECEKCPAGYKCPGPGATAPDVCGIGSYSRAGSADCEPCDKGHYCNLNTTSYDAMKYYNVCPEGTMCNMTGVDHIPDLKTDPCPLGYWCVKGDVRAYDAEPQKCPKGRGLNSFFTFTNQILITRVSTRIYFARLRGEADLQRRPLFGPKVKFDWTPYSSLYIWAH